MESEYNALKARESAMVRAVNQYRDEAQGLAKKEIQYRDPQARGGLESAAL